MDARRPVGLACRARIGAHDRRSRRLSDNVVRDKIATRLATLAVDQIVGSILLTISAMRWPSPNRSRATLLSPRIITVSGGVSEYLFGTESAEFGDIAKPLAAENRRAARAVAARRPSSIPAKPHPRDRHRRLAIHRAGERQDDLSVQPWRCCPSTTCLWRRSGLICPAPSTRMPIDPWRSRRRCAELDIAPGARVAIAFSWGGDPDYPRLHAAAQGIAQALAGGRPATRTRAADDRRRHRPHHGQSMLTRELDFVWRPRLHRWRTASGTRLCRRRRASVAAGRRAGGDQVAALFIKNREERHAC